MLNIKKDIKGNFDKNKLLYTSIALFLISFFYMFFFTNNVPFFWDDQPFHQSYFKQPWSELFREFVSIGTDNMFALPGTVCTLLFKIWFYLVGYSIPFFRAGKAIFFALLIMLLFLLSNRYMKNYAISLLFSLFIMCSFSLFVQMFLYDQPYIVGEVFKIVVFILFLKDFHQKKTSVASQVLIAILAMLAIRTYQPMYSIPLIFGLYIVFNRFRNFKRYFILLAYLLSIFLPFKQLLSPTLILSTTPYSYNFINLKRILINKLFGHIISPLVRMEDLYYKPLIAVITFFGFWLFVISLIIYLFHRKHVASGDSKTAYKPFLLFLLAWVIAEIPLWIIVPDPTVRYVSPVIEPLMMLYFIFINKTMVLFIKEKRKFFLALVILLVSLACLTNIAYTTAFRAGWGSAFIGMEKVTNYIESKRKENSLVMYYSHSVAPEHCPMNISKRTKDSPGQYEVIEEGVEYRQVKSLDDFSPKNLDALSESYAELYVRKRVTGFRATEFPPIDFDSYPNLTLEAIVKGNTSGLFDRIIHQFTVILGINYKPQTFYIYKHVEN
ncbi:hypothetical protein KAW55_06085 [bacterium]|nr:hypothetical protein [bacterium]